MFFTVEIYLMSEFLIKIADKSHFSYAATICNQMGESAKARGTGIAKRSPDYIELKMNEGKAVFVMWKVGVMMSLSLIQD